MLAAVRAIGNAEIVIVSDDHDRENEGDLIIAAIHCTPEKMAFIIRHTSGIVCAPLTSEVASRLYLNPMVAANSSAYATNFTVSIDYKGGLSTGISACERSATCRALTNPDVQSEDFVRPGHVFPLIAVNGGVLHRAGHTEAAVDLCKLANLPPVGVIGELVNDDGTVMKGAQIKDFADRHGLVHVTVSDIVKHRYAAEVQIKKVSAFECESSIGTLSARVYRSTLDPVLYAAYVYGDIADGVDVPVAFQRLDPVRDLFFGSQSANTALKSFEREGRGVLVCRDVESMEIFGGAEKGSASLGRERDIAVGTHILNELGVRKFRNITLECRRGRATIGADSSMR